MRIGFDTSELKKLDRALASSVKVVSDQRIAGSALKKALKPMEQEMKRQAPTGRYSPRKVRYGSGGTQQPGGTRRDIRTKLVKAEGDEVARGLVGVSKAKGKAGRRTHLITRLNKNRRIINDFIKRTFQRTFDQTATSYGQTVAKEVERTMSKL